MLRLFALCVVLVTAVDALAADAVERSASGKAAPASGGAKQSAAKGKGDTEAKALSGMSILGNQEAPKALVIVSWKSSQVGDEVGIARALDDARQPVDKDVFMRELRYYDIRSGSK